MPKKPSPARPTALLAGATGLVGRSLLPRLLDADAYGRVVVLARSPAPPDIRAAHLDWRKVDFAHLPRSLPAVDHAYIALGTTIRVAGSQAAFRAVDLDAVVAVARAARAAGAARLGVVSALGADAHSAVFYNRVKGEMEAAVSELGYEAVVLAQPSLLLGDRGALGQPVRTGEMLAARFLGPLMGLVPRGVRPIAAATVAAALVDAVRRAEPGVHRLSSARMQAHADA